MYHSAPILARTQGFFTLITHRLLINAGVSHSTVARARAAKRHNNKKGTTFTDANSIIAPHGPRGC